MSRQSMPDNEIEIPDDPAIGDEVVTVLYHRDRAPLFYVHRRLYAEKPTGICPRCKHPGWWAVRIDVDRTTSWQCSKCSPPLRCNVRDGLAHAHATSDNPEAGEGRLTLWQIDVPPGRR